MGEMLLDPTDTVERSQKDFAPRLDSLAGDNHRLARYQQSKGLLFPRSCRGGCSVSSIASKKCCDA